MEELEEIRQAAIKRIKLSILITSAIVFPLIFIGKMIVFPNGIFGEDLGFVDVILSIMVGVVIVSLSTFLASKKAYKAFQDTFLQNFVKTEFEKHFEDVTVMRDGFSKRQIDDVELIRSGNTFSSNDRINGTYRGIRFSKADVTMQQVTTDSKGNSHTTTYFRGQWIMIEGLNKSVQELFVTNKSLSAPSKKKIFSASEFEDVKTESVDFNQVFKINSRSSHDAFYLLTPHVMERFLMYPRNKGFGVCLRGTDAHLAVDSGRDSLEAKLTRPINEKDFEGAANDITAIKITIDLLLEAEVVEQ